MPQLVEQIAAVWKTQAPRQRLTLIVSTALALAALAVVVVWAQQPTWGVLYTGLDPRDAQAVVQELQTQQVPVRIAGGGGSIEVPLARVEALRMKLAVQGLPESGKFGFLAMFSTDSPAQSSQVQKARYQKALEDELAHTIEALDEVRSARVHLVLPGERVVADDQRLAKASVTVGLRAGLVLEPEKVQAIARIVAGAVPELSLEQVNVLDTQGRVLWEGNGDGAAMAGSRQVEMRAALERDVNGKVGRVLEPLVGAEGFVVKTTAEVDFTRVSRREKSFDPDSAVVMSEERTKERQSAATERQNQRASYEYSVSESSIEQPVGQLRRLSVAVLVDQRRGDGPGASGSAPRAVPRSDEELSKIEQLVKGAIGFDAQRGDRVTVEQVAFRQIPVEPAAGGFDLRPWIPLARWAALAVLGLIALALLARPWLHALRQAAAGRAAGELLRAGAASGATTGLDVGSRGGPSAVEALRQRLASAAVEQPEGMAQTLRVWIHESRHEKQP